MATDITSTGVTDVELLHQFLGQRIDRGGKGKSLDETLAEFAEYRKQLEKLRAMIREAEEQSARGESGPLDLDEFFKRADARLAAKGIPE